MPEALMAGSRTRVRKVFREIGVPSRVANSRSSGPRRRVPQIRDTSDLKIPVSAPSALTRSSTFLVETPCRVGLHDHREQRLVDPPPAFEQRGKERPHPQLRDP
jgi:hypothetical protein